ncbi:MAG: thiamine-binding protein [Clostridiales bacterium]|nr:thiamine-binding protein [Clostridiales bacterium]
MAKVNLSLQVIPTVPDDQLYAVVDKVIEMIEDSGLQYVVSPFETSIEGELDELLIIVKNAQDICTDYGAERVVSIIKIDYKKEGVTIDEKISKYQR